MTRRSILSRLAALLPLLSLALLATQALAQTMALEEISGVEPSGHPDIVAVEKLHDFGQVEKGSEVTKVFVIRNEGTADLKIIRAKGS